MSETLISFEIVHLAFNTLNISLRAYTIGKGMNPTVFSQVMGKY